MAIVGSASDFRSLSLRDLLEAREQYHWTLTNLRNVIGTAVGLYLIRVDDPWPDRDHPAVKRRHGDKPARTLYNSEVRPYSWPCILVFVSEWLDESEFGGRIAPQEIVPKTLYLPDGRMVPVCVVLAERGEPAADRFTSTVWPNSKAGGGFGLIVDTQHMRRRASVGCLVTDGHTLYALTNRHVCGAPGERILAEGRAGTVEIGTASPLQLSRRPLEDVYPTFAGTGTYLNIDAGLVEVDDANRWTASVYGLGDVGELADLNEGNIGVTLIDRTVRAYGAASGQLAGTIKALFYRYKSVGGADYVADLLIAPRRPGTSTRPGDSGTVWHLEVRHGGDEEPSLHPLAVEWGAQTFRNQGEACNFTLATNLSTICRLLDVEVVLTHNLTARPFWGATGHYTVARVAVAGVKEPKLGPFLRENAGAISFDRAALEPGDVIDELKDAAFVPLADVPDVVWKRTPWTIKGGRDTARNVGPEHPTHYCDIDEPGPDGQTLRAKCMADPRNVDVEVWRAFYTETGHTQPAARGCLPFRVWQFYDAMVALASAGDYAGYLCAAGLLAHYVGDACQPLHGSIYADGDPHYVHPHTTRGGKTVMVKRGEGVHSAFETDMVDRHAAELFPAIEAKLAGHWPRQPAIKSGHDAAVATVRLMDRAAGVLPPTTLVDTYVDPGGGTSRRTIDGLWAAFADETATLMADGIRVLQQIWVAAWRQGDGAVATAAQLGAIDPLEIVARYTDTQFVPSLDLDHIGAALT